MTKLNVQKSHLVMGLHSIEAVLNHSPERIVRVFHLKIAANSNDRKTSLIAKLKDARIKLIPSSAHFLDDLCQSTSHQGIAAELKERAHVDIDDFLETNTSKLVIALDTITDPHNLGAILRACECFGVGLVIWSKNRGAALSPVVSKTSSSATEFVPIKIVSNLATTIDKFIKADYTIIGVHVSQDSQNLFNYEFPSKTLLILGAEAEGIRPILQKKLDASLMIPMHGTIDSLNVSQAAAIAISVWKNKATS